MNHILQCWSIVKLDYSMIMHQIIHSLESYTSLLLNLLLKLLSLKLLICGNAYLTFNKNMEHNEDHGDM